MVCNLSTEIFIWLTTYVLAGFPLQAYLTAQTITVFQYTGQDLLDSSSYWALRLFLLAIGVGLSYFLMCIFMNCIQVVSISLGILLGSKSNLISMYLDSIGGNILREFSTKASHSTT